MLERLLVPVDGSACSEESARLALALAERAGSQVIFLNVAYQQPVHGMDDYAGNEHALHHGRSNDLLEHFMRLARAKGVPAKADLREYGTVPANIVAACKERECDLIVVGTHAREGIGRALIGSVAERVARTASTPVLLARYRDTGAAHQRQHAFEHLLVPSDGSNLSIAALDVAGNIARRVGGKVDVLHVIPDLPIPTARRESAGPGADELERDLRHEGEAILESSKQYLGSVAGETILYGANGVRVGDVIARVAHDQGANMVVMGTHGRGGIDRMLLGSVAERVAHRAEVPVMLVRAQATASGQA